MEIYRIHKEAAVYFVTYSIIEWLPVFVSEPACRIVADSLNFCDQHKGLCTNAFVIMPTHFHGIFFDRSFDSQRLLETLGEFRKFTGRSLSDYCTQHLPRIFTEAFRKAAGPDRIRRFWQPSRHPEAINTENFWKQKLDYLHDNPCRNGLIRSPEHWRFSSARYYLTEGSDQCDVRIHPLRW